MDRRHFIKGSMGVGVGVSFGVYLASDPGRSAVRAAAWRSAPRLSLTPAAASTLSALGAVGPTYVVGGSAAAALSDRAPSSVRVIVDLPSDKLGQWLGERSFAPVMPILGATGAMQFRDADTQFVVESMSLDSYRQRLTCAERGGRVPFVHGSLIVDPKRGEYCGPADYVESFGSTNRRPALVLGAVRRRSMSVVMQGYSDAAEFDLSIGEEFAAYSSDVGARCSDRPQAIVVSVVDHLPALCRVLPPGQLEQFFRQRSVQAAFETVLGSSVENLSHRIARLHEARSGNGSQASVCLASLLNAQRSRQRLELCYLGEKRLPKQLGMVTRAISLAATLS